MEARASSQSRFVKNRSVVVLNLQGGLLNLKRLTLKWTRII